MFCMQGSSASECSHESQMLRKSPWGLLFLADAADLGGAWLLSFLCLALIRGQGDRLTLVGLARLK